MSTMLSLSVPKIRGERPKPVEVRPRRVEAWLSELDSSRPNDSAQQLHQALFAQNRVPLAATNRLSLMELYQEPLLAALASLQRDYGSVTSPLNSRNRALLDLTQRLVTEAANSYKIVVNDITSQGKIESLRDELALALQRAAYFLGQRILNAYQVYVSCPSGIWQELHQLYAFAETHRLLSLPVNVPVQQPDGEELTSFSDTYIQIALVGACNPYGFLQGECTRFFDLIPLWNAGAEIIKNGKHRDAAGRFLINLQSDLPPIPLIKSSKKQRHAEDSRLINAIDVVKEVHSVLKGLDKGSTMRALNSGAIAGVDATQADLLRRVGRMLGGVNVRRKSKRNSTSMELTICTGVNAIHYFANDQQPFEPPRIDKPTHASELMSLTVQEREPDEQFLDLSDPNLMGAYVGEPPPAASLSPWQQGAVYRLHTCRARDQSATGLCMRIKPESELTIRVGDPIGLQYASPGSWRVGVVRWLRNSSANLDIGVQLLAPDLLPVAVRRQPHATDDDPPFFQALLLPGNVPLKQPESLLVPRGTYTSRDKLEMSRAGQPPAPVVPLRLLDRTGSYDQLLLAPPPV